MGSLLFVVLALASGPDAERIRAVGEYCKGLFGPFAAFSHDVTVDAATRKVLRWGGYFDVAEDAMIVQCSAPWADYSGMNILVGTLSSGRRLITLCHGPRFMEFLCGSDAQAPENLESVIAHEIGHIDKHSWRLASPQADAGAGLRSLTTEHRADVFAANMMGRRRVLRMLRYVNLYEKKILRMPPGALFRLEGPPAKQEVVLRIRLLKRLRLGPLQREG
jgi:hypothetical protein